jgi:hypothetical protein
VILNRPHHPSYAGMRPDDGRVRMTFEERLHLTEVSWWGSFLGERHIDIVVDQNHKAHLGGEFEYAVESRILEAGDLSRNLCRDESL